jgi:hypothetical protein
VDYSGVDWPVNLEASWPLPVAGLVFHGIVDSGIIGIKRVGSIVYQYVAAFKAWTHGQVNTRAKVSYGVGSWSKLECHTGIREDTGNVKRYDFASIMISGIRRRRVYSSIEVQ